jgi:hypothetical protein
VRVGVQVGVGVSAGAMGVHPEIIVMITRVKAPRSIFKETEFFCNLLITWR